MESSTLLLVTILIASISLYYFVLSKLSHFERLKIPYVRPIPLLGNMAPITFRRISFVEYLQRICNFFPDAKYFGFYEFTTPIFIIRDPDLISTIAIKQFDNFCDHRSFVDKTLEPIGGRILFNLHGDHWREMRKLLSPSFTSSKMKMMFGLMCQCAENFVNFVVTQAGEAGKTYDMSDILSKYANDTVATCAFGIEIDSFKYPNNEFFLLGKKVNFGEWSSFVFFMQRNFASVAKFFKLRLFGPKVENFFKNVVATTVKTRDEQEIVRPDMIQLMMETRNKNSGPEFDIDEMTAQAFVFFLAGFETVSRAMCFMTYHVGVNPDVQRKLREEIDDAVRQTNGKPTYEVINRMKYLDAAVNESLRLYPIAVFLDRKCVKETELPPATPNGESITLKPGDYIWFPISSVHHDPKYYSHPDKFDPDRFLNGNVDNSVYMPFGIGPRICIGNRFALMEIKIMLFYLLWHCDLEPDVKTKIPMVLSKKTVFTTADEGFWLKLRERKSKAPVTPCLSDGYTVEGQ